MAHLYRLILLAGLWWVSFASASVAPQPTGYQASSPAPYNTVVPTLQQACVNALGWFNATFGNRYTLIGCTLGSPPEGAQFKRDDGATGYGQATNRVTQQVCPVNSTKAGSVCTCDAGYVENSTQTACEPPPDPCKGLKGQSAGIWWKDQGDSNGLPMKVGFSVCDRYNDTGGGQCIVTVPDGPDTLCVQASGGYWQCSGMGYYTGDKAANAAKCTVGTAAGSGSSPSDPAPASPPISENPRTPPATPAAGTAAPAPCPSGQAPGQINGATVCRPTGSDRPTASGTGSSTTTNNSDGSSTTNTTTGTTKCEQGQCTSTTNNTSTTINAPGNGSCPSGQTAGTTTVNGQSRTTCTGTSSGTSTRPQAAFCKDNPKDKQCGGDGSDTGFGGTCAGGFKAVSDDAVLNAMAEEQYKRNCQFFEKVPDPTEDTQAHDAMRAKGKQGVDQTADLPASSRREVTIGPGDFDYSSAIGPQQCFTDRSVSIWGRSVAIPLSIVCPWLEILGNILVVVGSLLAARIVVRG